MSNWMRLGVAITDLGCFKRSCERNGIVYSKNEDPNYQWRGCTVHAVLQDKRGPDSYLLIQEGGGYKVVGDTDSNYSSLTKRLGKNGGMLGRDYSQFVVEETVVANGGLVSSVEEQKSGALVLRVGQV